MLRALQRRRLNATVMASGGAGFVPVDIPQSEADALIALYNETGGDNWTNKTNWLTDTTVNNWYGVTVAAGHVSALNLTNNNLVGTPGTFDPYDLPNALTIFLDANAGLVGDISGWKLSSLLRQLRIHVTGLHGAPDMSEASGMRDFRYQGCNMSPADTDAVLLEIYTYRMSFTYATPSLQITSNGPANGTYQAQCPPTTGQEYAYELVNDSCGDGFNKWSITLDP